MHTNICSLSKNLGNLEVLKTSLEHTFDIIALSETWIANNKKLSAERLIIPGYQSYIGPSGKSVKGGCGFFVSCELHINPREDLNIPHTDNNSEFEANWIEIQLHNDKKIS